MGKLHLSIISFIMLISVSMTTWGVVNQNIGIPDTQFNNLSAEACKQCHAHDPYDGQQTFAEVPYFIGSIADEHHQHTGTVIAGGPEQPPYMDANGDFVEDTVYTCGSCHGADPYWESALPQEYTNCLNCHRVEDDERTVHHDTPQAKEGECAACHGDVVKSLDAGRAPPDWEPGFTTPWISNKPMGDTTMTSSAGTHPGNCDFCHNVDDASSTNPLPSSFGPITVFSNEDTHHGTGVPSITGSSKGSPCFWCHPRPEDNLPDNQRIRICQRCHDVESLHSIQYDVNGDGVIPDYEPPYQGHIGSREDCWGCHGFDEAQLMGVALSSMPVAAATAPQLYDISALTWKEGTELEMTLSGNGFINQGGLDNSVTYRPTVQLTDSEGNAAELLPIAESVDSAQVTIPGLLPAGNYLVQIKKNDMLSNPIGVSITPAINVRPGGAICLSEYRVVILRGAGFNVSIPNWWTSITGIIGDGVDASRVFLWRDGMIAARFNAGCPGEVTVNTVFDSVTLMPEIR